MKGFNSFDQLYDKIWLRKVPFFITFFIVMLLSYGALYSIDFLPEPVTETEVNEVVTVETLEVATVAVEQEDSSVEDSSVPISPLPVKIILDTLDGREIDVLNPTEATIPAMDEALLSGVVRHPDTADFENIGNMLLLGHSSYIPNVLNKNFQAFNGIQKMTWGDTIRLQSSDTEYVYRVERVREEKATEVIVPFDWGVPKITLVTCNSFGAKEDRFIVEAKLVSSTKL